MKHEIARVREDDLAHPIKAGKREGLLFVPETKYAAYFIDGAIHGFCGLKGQKARAVFRNLYVNPASRGRGIGEALIRYQIEWASDIGYRKAIAYCTPKSVGLYRKCGGVDMPHDRFHDVVIFDLGSDS